MAHFKYKAISSEGVRLNDFIEAESAQVALNTLVADGKKVIDIAPVGKKSTGRKVKNKALKLDNQVRFFEDLAVLLNAGVNIDQALVAVKFGVENKALANILSDIISDISAGVSPSNSFKNTGKFTPEVIALIASGEKTASLGTVFDSLAQDAKARSTLQQRLVEAMAYPAFLIFLTVCSVLLIAFALVPALMPIFETSNAETPFILLFLSGLRSVILNYGGMLVIACLVLLVLIILPATKRSISTFFHRLLIGVPFVGTIFKKLVLARYLRSFSLLMTNKVDMPSALKLSAAIVPMIAYQRRLEGVVTDVSAGVRLPAALENTALFDQDVLAVLQIGDDVNRLALTSDRAAFVLQNKAQRQIDRALAIMTPAITIGLGLLIGFLVVSVMTALLSVNDLAVG